MTNGTPPPPPKMTAVVLLGVCFVIGALAIGLDPVLEKMQAKSKTGGLDYFDFARLLLTMTGLIALNTTAFMNRGYSRYKDEKEKHDTEIRKLTETEFLAQEIERGKKDK